MAEKSIVTQGQLGDLKSILSQEADSLEFHSADSMSKAHGFNIIQGPAADSSGNDLTNYRDSNGDVVGTHMLHVVVGGTDYYAPVSPTALSGQDPLTGIAPDLTSLLQPGDDNCWVTDYATASAADATAVLTGLLLPHTQQYYAATHSGITAIPQVTNDSSGHIVGTHVLIVYFGTKKIYIPCATRMGGPAQTLKITTDCPVLVASEGNTTMGTNICPCAMTFSQQAGAANSGNFWLRYILTGTMPFSTQWQCSIDGTNWTDMVFPNSYPGTNAAGGLNVSGTTGYGHDNPVVTGITDGKAEFSAHPNTPGGNDSTTILIRLKATNSGGSVYSCALSYHIQDHAPGCWFCTEANKELRLAPDKWQLIGKVEQAVYKLDRRALASYIRHGDRLVAKMKANGVSSQHFSDFLLKIVDLAERGLIEEAAKFYIKFVTEDVRAYWPDAGCRGWQAYLKSSASLKSSA